MAKPPAPQKIDYLYCENPKCTYHATHLVANKPKDLGPGSPCPLSAPDKLVMIELTTTAPIPPPTPTDPPTGIVLPAAPYGGFMLMLEDDDESSTWERAKQTDAPHTGARYVAELRRDLVRLAFYAGTRFQAGEPAGKVTLPLVASVLDLKRHLTQFYGVPASDKLDEVKKDAASGTGKIYFRQLRNPAEVYNQFRSWQLTLVGGGSTMEQKLAKFGDEWAKRKRAGKVDSRGEIAVAQAEITTRGAELGALRARRDQLRKDVDALKGEIALAKNERARIKASLAGKPAEEVKELDEKLKELDRRIGDAEKKVKELDAEISKQKPVIDELDKKLQAMGPKLLAIQKSVSARDRGFKLMREAVRQIGEEAQTAAADAAALTKAPPAPFGWPLPPSGINLGSEKASAVSTIDGWRAEPSPPSKPGLLHRLSQQATDIEAAWTKSPAGTKPVAPPPDWSEFKTELDTMRKQVFGFHDEVKASDASTLFDNYRQELREFGTVDQATARYIRQMLTAGSLNTIPVFFNPMDEEVEKFDVSDIRKVIGDIVDELALTAGNVVRTRANVPVDLLEFIFGHESGKNHTMKWGGREFVILGIDWAKLGLVSYNAKTLEKIETLLKKREQKIQGVDPTKPIAEQLDDGKLLEFPCSWVTAVLRYAGSGDQAYWYALEALWTVAGKPTPSPSA